MRLSDEDLRGRVVIASDGRRIGEIVALYFDDTDWKLATVRVKLNKEIADRVGATRTVFHAGTIEIPVGMIQSVRDAAVLSVKVDDLRQMLQPPPPAEEAPIH
jgi:sporulation protein YlmC with PRC-barrel domain